MRLWLTCVATCALIMMTAVPSAGSSGSIGLHGALGLPQGDFKSELEDVGYGFGLDGYYRFGDTPISLGASFDYLVYGNETRVEDLITPLVKVDVTTTNSIFAGHLVARYQLQHSVVRPYFDGLIGFHYLSTETSVSGQGASESIASSTNFEDTALSYGLGAGLTVRVHQKRFEEEPEKPPACIHLNLGIRYLLGGDAEYLKEGSIDVVGDEVRFDVKKSSTDILLIHLGVILSTPL